MANPNTAPFASSSFSASENPNRARLEPQQLEIIFLSISKLAPSPDNPRIHTQRQVRQIAESIRTFGFNVPILVDRNGEVIAGHGRLLACQLLGWTEVPTISLEHLSPAQAKAYRVADNKLTENGTWDEKLLGQVFLELGSLELDFSLETTGFEMGEIDLLIEGLAETPPGDDPADTCPAPSLTPVTRPGDLWRLGPHRVLCGSVLEEQELYALMEGRKADLVFTDPPYNVPIEGNVGGLGTIHHREFAMGSGEMSPAQFTEFLTRTCQGLAANSKDGSLHYVCMDWRHIRELLAAGEAAYTELKNLCVWAKDNAGMGSLYRSQHELVFVFKKGTSPHQNHVQLGRSGRYRTNVWRYAGVNSFGRSTEEGNLLKLHPTVKPVALVADALKDVSSRGDLVLDAFLGSGTTLIAAEKTGRCCCGLEIDPLYVDTAIRRWEAFTGQDAFQAVSGRSFKDLEGEQQPGPVPGAGDGPEEVSHV